ncbi:MAG TPA: helix-turn-helix domain-containing protein [Candidatus Polarisedimenticolaceae bacterium]|nr:helix-turn-helix domain-containing protein [Candidatus Polarisedimenticolaceae bacterium]
MRHHAGKSFLSETGETVERSALLEDEILTSEEARRLLKIGRTKLWDLTRRNMIPAYRVGEGRTSGLRYKRSELLHWLDQNRI